MSVFDTNSDVENRHEIVFLYDAEQSNPNGDPLSSGDQPRVDAETKQAIATDVRLKRYVRDQLTDDGYGVYIMNPQKMNGDAEHRDALFTTLMEMDEDEIEEMEDAELFPRFLDKATDVRLFGATLSFSEEFEEWDTPQFTGPVQFSHGRSLNEVVPNDASKKLSTLVASDKDTDTGTFADDNRLQYALMNFHGIINENAAENTGLSVSDIELLDDTLWRSLLSQTLTRSKEGHKPRLYLRVEYESGYHSGDLHHHLSVDEEHSVDSLKMRNIGDVVVNVDDLLAALERDDRVKGATVKTDQYVTVSAGGETGGPDFFHEKLADVVPELTEQE